MITNIIKTASLCALLYCSAPASQTAPILVPGSGLNAIMKKYRLDIEARKDLNKKNLTELKELVENYDKDCQSVKELKAELALIKAHKAFVNRTQDSTTQSGRPGPHTQESLALIEEKEKAISKVVEASPHRLMEKKKEIESLNALIASKKAEIDAIAARITDIREHIDALHRETGPEGISESSTTENEAVREARTTIAQLGEGTTDSLASSNSDPHARGSVPTVVHDPSHFPAPTAARVSVPLIPIIQDGYDSDEENTL